jgi:hypothetical protein
MLKIIMMMVKNQMGRPSCQAKVNGRLQNIRKTPVFWSCTAGGSGVALPHIHLQRYYPSIANNRLSFLVFEHELLLYRMNPVRWQNRAFRKLCFEEDNFFFYKCHWILNLLLIFVFNDWVWPFFRLSIPAPPPPLPQTHSHPGTHRPWQL